MMNRIPALASPVTALAHYAPRPTALQQYRPPPRSLITSPLQRAPINPPSPRFPDVTDTGLADALDNVFRPGDRIPGGTPTILDLETHFGTSLFSSTGHRQKSADRARQIAKIRASGRLNEVEEDLARRHQGRLTRAVERSDGQWPPNVTFDGEGAYTSGPQRKLGAELDALLEKKKAKAKRTTKAAKE